MSNTWEVHPLLPVRGNTRQLITQNRRKQNATIMADTTTKPVTGTAAAAAKAPITTDTAVAQVPTTASEAIDAAFKTAISQPLPEGREGLEDFTREDILIPRLSLAQPLSPQVIEGDPRYIKGLTPGMFFNSITNEVYGKEVFVQIIKKEPLRAMEFFPQADGGGVKDPNVGMHDERLKWGEDGEKPVATLFRDYLARVMPTEEFIALSFKSSGIKAAKTLNGLIVLRRKAVFAGRYRITSGMDLNPKPHYIYQIENAGEVTYDQMNSGREMWLAVKDLPTADSLDRDETNVEDFEFGANVRDPGGDDGAPEAPRADM